MSRFHLGLAVAILVSGCGSPAADTAGERIMTDAEHSHYHVHGPNVDHGHTHADFTAGGHTHEHVGH